MLESMHYTISQKVSEIFDLYTELHNIRISLFSPDGTLLYPDAVGRPDCTHCKMLREKLGLDSKCRELDRKMMQTAFAEEKMISYTCHAGMREATAPILIDGELVGYVMLGQFRSETAPDHSPYAKQWLESQGNEELQRAYERTVLFPEHKIGSLLGMFSHLLELIIRGQLIQHKDYDLIEPVIDRIVNHPEHELTLEDAAGLIGRSHSTTTRLFKRVTGRSFKQYQTDHRLGLAAELLKSSPHRPVSEIGAAVGYADPLYFSRAFHRKHGCSPSEYRNRVNAGEDHADGAAGLHGVEARTQ